MPRAKRHSAVVFQESGNSLLGRIEGLNGQPITQASLTSIIYEVTDLSDESQVKTGTVTIANAVHDSLQTPSIDPRWTVDLIGFNFEFSNLRTDIPNPKRAYLFEFLFEPASGEKWPIQYELNTLKVYGTTF